MTASTIERVVKCLSSRRFSLNDEKRLQEEIAVALLEDGIEAEREVQLSTGDIIDFIAGNIGIEAKLKGRRRAIYSQCERYCRHDRIGSLLLVTNAAMGFPDSILGKPTRLLSLGRAWL